MNRMLRAALASLLFFVVSLANAQSTYPHLAIGNPSNAKEDAAEKNNFLMKKKYFALSYNNAKGTPNWVSWRLTEKDTGSAKRFSFHPDDELPDGFKRIVTKQYTNSGFDRGHVCPHSDRSKNETMSKATFVMSNIMPQSAGVNRHAWEQLEIYLRDLVKDEDKEIYIMAGPAGKGGCGDHGFATTISGGEITVPAQCWKIALVLDKTDDDDPAKAPQRVDKDTRIIAVVIPNVEYVGEDWSRFRTSVNQIEDLTGFKFFDKVPDSIIGPLKEVVDDEEVEVQAPVIHGH
jgi:endonuclease G, mitochondrial